MTIQQRISDDELHRLHVEQRNHYYHVLCDWKRQLIRKDLGLDHYLDEADEREAKTYADAIDVGVPEEELLIARKEIAQATDTTKYDPRYILRLLGDDREQAVERGVSMNCTQCGYPRFSLESYLCGDCAESNIEKLYLESSER